jgi:KDO2-lipid IV(A) lauroyltransferase
MHWQVLISGLLRLTACLPLPVIHAFGAWVGWLLWLIPNTQRRIAAINLALCFPEWSAVARRRLLRRTLVETSKTMFELGPLWLWNRQRVLALVRAVEGEEALRTALADGRSAILITPHLGSWEMAGLYYSAHYPLTTLYRPDRLGLEALSRAGRGRLGARLVATNPQGVRALLQALRENGVLGILPDQDPGRESGLFVPFFGLPTNTMTLVSRLAMKTGAAVLLTYAERLPWGQGYKIHLEPLPSVVGTGPLEVSVAAMNAAIEQAVRCLPEQYLWSYKRFKRRPPGEDKFY